MAISRRGLPLSSPTGSGEGPELVFALTGALGTNVASVADALSESLRRVDYDARTVHVVELLHDIASWRGLPEDPIDLRIETHQDAGNAFRRQVKHGGAMALLATAAIRADRGRVTGDAKRPISRCAYILRSLKHPEEARTLRRIYGRAFFLIAAYSPHGRRIDRLAEQIARSHHSGRADEFRERAEELIQRDQAEPENPYGQNVRELFPMADVFVNVDDPEGFRGATERFVDLIFGRPFVTPTRDEYAMFHARAAALRSADRSRQVGAVIATRDGDVIAVGSNEVPKAGGGLYWAGDSPDLRDFQLPDGPRGSLRASEDDLPPTSSPRRFPSFEERNSWALVNSGGPFMPRWQRSSPQASIASSTLSPTRRAGRRSFTWTPSWWKPEKRSSARSPTRRSSGSLRGNMWSCFRHHPKERR